MRLKTPIMHQGSSGQWVELTFDLERQAAVEEAASRVFQVGSGGLNLLVQGLQRTEASPPPVPPLPLSQLTRRSPSPRRATAKPLDPLSRQRVKVYSRRRKMRRQDASKLKGETGTGLPPAATSPPLHVTVC